ncbi:Ppx/GppA family phosphatase [Campylobacter sp. RM12910]|uniref:Ppx/GppA phosphatase family protein n=1 Tax=Campylobacter molothri TaxID=1032242 RepID=UPI00301DBE80|nr:Ppx/GppA family phosphatase [Campylobacter sp. RM12910]MBZ7937274.1 Ppx/GppA family phosphatase [Campylobacter sp. RM10538]MBZ7970123.1 Ppx/GppA family phosphatase [Campylobacter sp. RM3125]MBZ7971798.1 Ppx/GppA family phosphatase [Campylobacter sp. RM3124]
MLGIDLGSNTLRAVEMDENFKKIKEYEFIIGAAKNLSKTRQISTEAIEKIKEALNILSKEQNLNKAKAVATAAFRKADNTDEIFKDLKEQFGVHFRVIDAKTEAKISVLGMKKALASLDIKGYFAYCDLGGASCELSFDQYFQSFDFGIISFYEKCNFQNDFPTISFKKILKKYPNFVYKIKDKKLKIHLLIKDKKLKNIAFKAFDEVKELKKVLKKSKARKVILNSGVPTALAALKCGLNYEKYDAKKINGKILYTQDFFKFALKIWNMSEKDANFYLGKTRKKYLTAGCFLFFAIFDKEECIVIDEGLREGLCMTNL